MSQPIYNTNKNKEVEKKKPMNTKSPFQHA